MPFHETSIGRKCALGVCPGGSARGGGGYLPQVWVPTVKRTPKAVVVKAETEEQCPLYTLKFSSNIIAPKTGYVGINMIAIRM